MHICDNAGKPEPWAALVTELEKVLVVYGKVQVEALEDGLLVKPSLTHISRKDAA